MSFNVKREDILAFIQKAGANALALQQGIDASLKGDDTVVTQADLANSTLFADTFGHLFADSAQHYFVDEEKLGTSKPADILGKSKYLWILDPIDGTATYALGLPLWGVSLAILQDDQPWQGYIYLPALGELYVADGEKATVTYHAFTPQARTVTITPHDVRGGDLRFLTLGTSTGKRLQWQGEGKNLAVHAESVARAWAIAGKTCAVVTRTKPWDFSMAWPMHLAAGQDVVTLESGTPVTKLVPELLRDDWHFKEHFITCAPALREQIVKGLVPTAKN